MTVIGLSLNF